MISSEKRQRRRLHHASSFWSLGVALVVAFSSVLATPVNASSTHDGWSVQKYTTTPYCVTSSLCLGISFIGGAGIGSAATGSTILATSDANGPRPVGPVVIATIRGSSTSTAFLTDISCAPGASMCAAVGNATGSRQGHSVAGPFVVYTNALGKRPWHIVVLSAYKGIAGTDQNVSQVTCVSATSCIAIGGTQNGTNYPLLWTTSNAGATWRFESATLPQPTQTIGIASMTCANATTCVAYDGGLLFTDRGPAHFQLAHTPAIWTKKSVVTAGVAYNSTSFILIGVSCIPGSGGCVAVGSTSIQRVSASRKYSSSPSVPFIATSPTGSVWSALPTVMPKMPKNTQLGFVSCAAKNECVVAGVSGASAGGFGGKPVILRTSGSIFAWQTLPIPHTPVLSKIGSEQGLTCGLTTSCSVTLTDPPFTLAGPA